MLSIGGQAAPIFRIALPQSPMESLAGLHRLGWDTRDH
jgi:hypothetical protein